MNDDYDWAAHVAANDRERHDMIERAEREAWEALPAATRLTQRRRERELVDLDPVKFPEMLPRQRELDAEIAELEALAEHEAANPPEPEPPTPAQIEADAIRNSEAFTRMRDESAALAWVDKALTHAYETADDVGTRNAIIIDRSYVRDRRGSVDKILAALNRAHRYAHTGDAG